ncbi:hypothetical protein JXA88_12865 [Candidatus Fermentibacteria bacterium]|nr:hypothetical protein [Candidatus Fermentibacteria bacterium]
MHTKLTLRMEDETVRRAKAWAQARGVSLSDTVAKFFREVSSEEEARPRLCTWTQRLSGAVAAGGEFPRDDEIRDAYHDHVERKHR